jgi:hypothetical protein
MRTASSLAGVDRWHFPSSDLVSSTDGHEGCARPESVRVETLVQCFAHHEPVECAQLIPTILELLG